MSIARGLAIAAFVGSSASLVAQDLSLGEVGTFSGSFNAYRVNQFTLPLVIPGTIVPPPPTLFDATNPTPTGNVDFVADFANLTLITGSFSFPAGSEGAFVELANGNYGLVQDLNIQWNGANGENFANVVFLFDFFAVNGTSLRFVPQIVPSSDSGNDFDAVRFPLGGAITVDGTKLPLGFVTGGAPFGVTDQPLRAWRLSPLGVLNNGATATVTLVFDLGVPAEDTAVGSSVEVTPLDRNDPTNDSVTVTYSDVDAQGKTMLATSSVGPDVPAGFQLGDPATYYDLSTTAKLGDGSSIEVCIHYDAVQFNDENALHLLHYHDGNWVDITSSLDTVNDLICGITDSFSAFAIVEAVPDTDSDGLTDDVEAALGTNPNDPDTDDDGLLDGTEVDMAMGSGCPDPLDPDSDDDTINDGDEVAAGTNPCSADTDGDGVSDADDPLPLEPGVTYAWLQSASIEIADAIDALPLTSFTAPNANASAGRRNSLSTRVRNAAKAFARGDAETAIELLTGVLQRVDGPTPVPDWMADSPAKSEFAAALFLLIELAELSG